jgi:hypothetical protein
MGTFVDKIGEWSRLYPQVGPILICLVLLAITLAFSRSGGAVGKTICVASFGFAVVFGGVATYLYIYPPPDPGQRFETTWTIEDPCRWGISQISRVTMPIRKDYDKEVAAYAVDDFDESRVIVLLSGKKKLDLGDVNTIYVNLRNSPTSLHLCINNLEQTNRIMLLPASGDPSQCAGLSDTELAHAALDFWQETNLGSHLLCQHS